MSEVIRPVDYTPGIQSCIEELAYRMANTLTDYKSDDFVVVKDSDVTFVLANPVLGEELMHDDFGRVTELIPMRNITMLYYDGPPEMMSPVCLEYDFDLKIRLPRVRVLRPDLCLKIVVGGKVMDCAFDDLEAVVVRDWERQLTIKEIFSGWQSGSSNAD